MPPRLADVQLIAALFASIICVSIHGTSETAGHFSNIAGSGPNSTLQYRGSGLFALHEQQR